MITGQEKEISDLQAKIKECDKQIEQLRELKPESFERKLEKVYNERLDYEKSIDELVRSQFERESLSFNAKVNQVLKESFEVEEQMEKEDPKLIFEETQKTISQIKQVQARLSDYSVNCEESELDSELEEVKKELERNPVTPWYLNG
mmetsp:Transcript_2146/g.3428  ORF Transcript_2146/g.3428 Transcript_2146/m.3428 type:complete len:147 (-) Transcript_2146:6-446(-)